MRSYTRWRLGIYRKCDITKGLISLTPWRLLEQWPKHMAGSTLKRGIPTFPCECAALSWNGNIILPASGPRLRNSTPNRCSIYRISSPNWVRSRKQDSKEHTGSKRKASGTKLSSQPNRKLWDIVLLTRPSVCLPGYMKNWSTGLMITNGMMMKVWPT